MQFAVPQFTEVEDRLIGSLTLKQFFVLLATGALIMLFWSILGPSFLFFILSFPFAVVGIAIALARYNGRPMFAYLVPFAGYIGSDRVMVFKREVPSIRVPPAVKKDVKKTVSPEDLEPAESRLKKLAYLLDQKNAEAEEIISHDEKNIIQTTAMPAIDFNKVVGKVAKGVVNTLNPILKAPAKTSTDLGSPLKPGKKAAPAPQKPPGPKKFDPSSFLK